ncbi:MAG: hypothetical protein RL394_963, partial [Bacteroidota bacterium]
CVDNGHQFSIIIQPALLSFGRCIVDNRGLEIIVIPFGMGFPMVLPCYEYHQVLGGLCSRLPKAKRCKFLPQFLRFDPIEFPQLHVAAVGRKDGQFQRFFDDLIGHFYGGVITAVGSPAVDNGFKCLLVHGNDLCCKGTAHFLIDFYNKIYTLNQSIECRMQ